MTKYMEFPSAAEAKAFAEKMGQALGLCDANGEPTAKAVATKTYRYTEPTEHPSDGRAICAVSADAEPFLVEAELAALKTPEAVAGFFPAEEA